MLLQVNGESVESLKHGEIAERVRQSGPTVSVTTITPQGLEFYTKVGSSTATNTHKSPPFPQKRRIVYVVQHKICGRVKAAAECWCPLPVSCSCSWVCPRFSSARRVLMRQLTERKPPQLSRRHRRKQAKDPNPDSAPSKRARWALALIWAASRGGPGPLSAR